MGQRGEDATDALARLEEVGGTEGARLDQAEYERIDLGSHCLHQVERKGRASFDVRVNDCDPRVEPDPLTGDDCLPFEQ
jgi:hypothetical protein